jgi:hypothetical protein
MNLVRLLELAGVKWPTIVSASTEKDGGINRKTADRMIDPHGYFAKNRSMMEDGWTQANNHENFADAAEAFGLDNFSPEEFIANSESELGDPEDPINSAELISVLEHYLRQFIQLHFVGNGDAYNTDLTDLVKTVYPQVRAALATKGYMVA